MFYIKTEGNVTTVFATGEIETIKAQGKLGVAEIVEKNYNNFDNKPSINGVELFGDLSTKQLKLNYEKLLNLPSINGFPLIGNKTTQQLGIVGTSMTEIEVSTDQKNPTDISVYLNKSGTYVSKNAGGILLPNGIETTIAKGGKFEVFNLKDSASVFGIDLPEEYNTIRVNATIFSGGMQEDAVFQKEGLEEWITEIKLTNENIYKYVELSGSSMTEIEISPNIENPTDISPYFEKSGTYVAKNYGIIGFGDFLTPIAKGGFFTVQNFKDDASRFGVEVSDEENVIMVSVFYYDGGTFEEVMLKKIGTEDWYAGVKITSLNAQDYLDLDIDVTSEVQQVLRNAVNNSYGMQLIGNYLSFMSANNTDIDLASTQYRVITPNNIKYSIEKWGKEYYATKQQAETLQTNINNVENKIDNLKSEIETILESVVVIDE